MHQAIDLTKALNKDSDMTSREFDILKEISSVTGFISSRNIWRSKYWGKNLGASHWLGKYDKKDAVLKIQGVRPNVSEIYMIEEFSKQNKSILVGPPSILRSILWNDKNNYEAIIAEHASGDKVVVDGKIATSENIATFLSYYKEYRQNCIPMKPWLPKPESNTNNLNMALDSLIATSFKAYPKSKLREEEDFALAKSAYSVLTTVYAKIELEFIHGHFSCKDLIYKNNDSKQVILFSNLFWKWRYPFFDAVFGYHWFMYELANVKDITPVQVDNQRKLWLDEIYKVTGAINSKRTRKLVNAALLERSVAGFIIDSFLCDPKKKISKYLYKSTKDEAQRLIKELR